MAHFRQIIGTGPAAPGMIFHLMMSILMEAKAKGFTITQHFCSRAGSQSRYAYLRDPVGREWLLRVSEHRLPRKSGNPEHHFDLVSLDGKSGLAEVVAWLGNILDEAVAWIPPDVSRRPNRKKPRKSRNAKKGYRPR